MRRSSFLRRGKRLLPVSAKRRVSELGRRWDPVYAAVDRRSGGRCEVILQGIRCPARATDHHHTAKPRALFHESTLVVHLCRGHHLQCDATMVHGKLVAFPLGAGLFSFRVVVKPSKFHPDPEAA